MKKKIFMFVMHLLCAIICASAAISIIISDPDFMLAIVLGSVATICWLGLAIGDFIDIYFALQPVRVICPKCGDERVFKNYISWVLRSPMHWFGKRYTYCPGCRARYWMQRVKNDK